MKKIYFLSMAAASLMLASCSSDDMPAPENGEFATVAVSVQLPDGLQTRYGEGNTATRLHYAVYAKGTKTPLAVCTNGADKNATEGLATINRSTTLSLQLASGQEYDMVFWADAEGSVYHFDAETQEVKALYDATDNGTAANQEALDAFYCAKTYKVSGNATVSAQLYRPFAQVNVVTDDLEAADNGGFVPANSSLKTKVATGLNLMDGTVTGDYTEVTFAANTLPTGTMEINGKEYDYIGMNYLLVPAEKSLRDMEFTLLADGTDNAETHVYNFNSVPVQRNYRTNIYGSLLTSSQSFNVEILPGFNDPDYQVATDTSSLANLLKQDNSNILFNQDMTTGEVLTSTGNNVVLNMNGKTLNNTTDLWNEGAGNWSLLSVRGGKLTITGNGNFFAKANDTFALDVQNGAHLVIENGHFKGNLDAVYVSEGTLEIRGGVFEIQQLNDEVGKEYAFMLNCLDANYHNGTAKIIVKGGIFVGYDPSHSDSENPQANFVADGYKSVKIDYNGKEAWQVIKE